MSQMQKHGIMKKNAIGFFFSEICEISLSGNIRLTNSRKFLEFSRVN